MATESNLSPFAHPKAQRYFATLLERSGLIREIEDTLQLTDDNLDLSHIRLLSAMLILLGRPGIWPTDKQRVLARASTRLSGISKRDANLPTDKRTKPLSLDQHNLHDQLMASIKTELELLRRRGGISNRVSSIEQPDSWGKFWS